MRGCEIRIGLRLSHHPSGIHGPSQAAIVIAPGCKIFPTTLPEATIARMVAEIPEDSKLTFRQPGRI
jgi:hypothetical protein